MKGGKEEEEEKKNKTQTYSPCFPWTDNEDSIMIAIGSSSAIFFTDDVREGKKKPQHIHNEKREKNHFYLLSIPPFTSKF